MDKVYIITAGTYSDYHIVAVFTEQAEAEQFRDTYNSRISYSSEECEIEEYPIGADISLAGKELYCARKGVSGEIYTWDTCEPILEHADDLGIVKRYNKVLECYVAVPMNQDDPEEYARKVAADLFAEYKARKEGIT